jgi:hypothetical protein
MAARVVFRGGSKVIQSHDEHLLFLLGISGTSFSFQIIYARIFLGKAPSRIVFFHFSSLLRFATQNNQLSCASKKNNVTEAACRSIECPASGTRIGIYFGGESTEEWRA